SLIAPSINLGDSVANPNVATADSMILPEITMEDSASPAAAAPAKPARPISEYDFDVVEPDPRRESTFHGEVVAGRPARPELAPVAASADVGVDAKSGAEQAPPPTGNDDSLIPVAAPFHDKIIEDHLLHQDDPLEQSRGPMRMVDNVDPTRAGVAAPAGSDATKDVSDAAGKDAKSTPGKPPERRATVEAIGPAAEDVPAALPASRDVAAVESPAAPAVPEAQSEAVEAAITQLVAEVNEQVAQVSEKVEVVAAKVERVAAKMSEVTKEVSEVAETAGTLQEAWTEFRGGPEQVNHPGTSENSSKGDKDGADKSRPNRISPAKAMENAKDSDRKP
ncbi:MAG: hypothetical protein M3478_05905, partial [Planctomycetota bacterium]|nr:hypothetical protein [Planctomycetota bacterium]